MTMDYRDLLKERFDHSTRRNPRFGLRGFARQLGISHTSLNHLFAKKLDLSWETFEQCLAKMSLTREERVVFVLAFDFAKSKSTLTRSLIQHQLQFLELIRHVPDPIAVRKESPAPPNP